MINNRQAGRRRGRGNGQRQGGNPGRPDNGNRIDNRARGNANQLYEKYKNLARDAQMQGDRVNTEYYLQFADHYFRVLNENRSRFEDQNQRRPRDDNFVNGFDSDFDGDEEYGDEGEPIRAGEQGSDDRGGDARRDEPRRDSYAREGQRRDGSGREGQGRGDQARDYQSREGQRRDGGRDRDGQRDDGRRDAQREDGRRNGAVNGYGDAPEAAEPRQTAPMPAPMPAVANDVDQTAGEPVAAEPRRRGRPRRERPADEAAPVAIEADRLPPAFGAGNDAEPASGEEPKPRRRRVRTAPGSDVTQAG